MASIYDRTESALEQLESEIDQFEHYACDNYSDDNSNDHFWAQFNRFKRNYRMLKISTIFLDFIHKWSDADEVLNLGSLGTIIGTVVEEIGDQLWEHINLPVQKDPSWTILFPNMRKRNEYEYQKERFEKFRLIFLSLRRSIELLKPEMEEAYDSLLSHSYSFQSHFRRHDIGHWEKFVEFIEMILCSFHENFFLNEREKIKTLTEKLKLVRAFLASLGDGSPKNSETEDAWIHFLSVTMRPIVLFFQGWWKMDPNFKEYTIDSILDLQQMIDSTNPEFVRMSLGLTVNARVNEAKVLVKLFLPFQEWYIDVETDVEPPRSLHWELKSLMTSVFSIPQECVEDKQMFLAEVKLVVMEAASFKGLLGIGSKNGRLATRPALLYLLAKIWLIKMETLLRPLLYPSLLSMEQQINTLNRRVKYLDLKRNLRFMGALIEDSRWESRKIMKQILTLMEEVDRIAPSLYYLIDAESHIRKTVRNLLFKLLLTVVLLKTESNFMDLYSKNESWMFFVKDKVEALHKGLKVLKMFVRDQPEDDVEEGKLVFKQIEAMARGVLSLCYSFPTNNITEEVMKDMNLPLSGLLAEMKIVMAELKDGYLNVPRSNFPKTNPMGFINSLLIKLRELLIYKVDLTVSVKHRIEEILQDLKFLTPFLRGILEQDIELQELKDLGACIIDVAYEAECFIDSMLLEDSVEWKNLVWFNHLLEDLRIVKTHVTKIYHVTDHVKVHNVPQTSVHKEPRVTTPGIDETVVVLKDQENTIIDRLIGGTPRLDIVSIIGMPGIGKTTLAKQVYNSPWVVPYFHIRTWCCVSEIYRKREVLLQILSHVIPLAHEILGLTDEDLDFKLRRLLLRNKYLIVVDDMWNTEALDDLGRSLPNDGNGSRILITSRHHHVASKSNPHADPHCLRQLSDAESWKLLRMKLFHDQCCPKELREIGEEIAKSCKGLPLAVVAIAGLLDRTDRQQNLWKEIAKDLSSQIVNDQQEHCRKILELSYNHLPDFLKACFLYLGAFLEDQDIPAQKLMRLWIAEGFVQKTESNKSLEDLAEDYLADLISRSLVIFAQPRAGGGAKTCRVHDVLRKLCQSKAKEDKFLQVVTRSNESNACLDDLYYVVSDTSSNASSSVTYEDHRLCFCSKREHFIESRPSGPHVRSLLFIATNDEDPRCPYDISFISQNFRLLNVLDLECINMGTSFPCGIERLVYLRYLAVAGYIDSVPSSVANLWNLETFVLKAMKKGMVKIPDTIWCLKRLRHLHVSVAAVFNLQENQHGDSRRLDYLVTLSSPFLCFEEDTDNILRQFPNLRKLKCVFSKFGHSQNCNQFPRLEVLTQLESLKISYYGRALHSGEFNLPLNLKKLTLSNFRLSWNKISVIGGLPNLEVLKLLSQAFDGETWEMVEGEFSELKFLKLDTLNIAKWNASSEDLPKLQQLVLRCCKNLKEVPSSVAEIPTLQIIDVQWCGDSVAESVRQIKEEGDESLKVCIDLAELDFSST